jgi:hypothetical protein
MKHGVAAKVNTELLLIGGNCIAPIITHRHISALRERGTLRIVVF